MFEVTPKIVGIGVLGGGVAGHRGQHHAQSIAVARMSVVERHSKPSRTETDPYGPAASLYNFRNVLVRWRATAATMLGVALVVTVYILMQAMAAGLVKSSQNTGDPRNVMIVRKGSTAESSSQVSREQLKIIQYLAGD